MHGLGGIVKMNSPGFKVGDKVVINGRDEATIVKVDHPVKDDANRVGALVEFSDKNLIPPQMEVPYRSIAPHVSLPVGQPTSGPGVSPPVKVVTGSKATVTINGQPVAFVDPDKVSYSIDPANCIHNWELHKGFSFDKLICSKCNEKKHYNPMEG